MLHYFNMNGTSVWINQTTKMKQLLGKTFPDAAPAILDPSSDNSPSSSPNSEHFTNHGTNNNLMDFEVFKAATVDDIDRFIQVLDRVSTHEKLPLSMIFNAVSLLGNTLLHVATSNENPNMVKFIFYHFPSLLSEENDKGDTALHLVAKSGKQSLFLAYNEIRNQFLNSGSPVYCGLIDKEIEFFEDLSLRVKNKKGNTPLHEALMNQHRWMSEQLVKADWEVSWFLNNDEESGFYLAAKFGLVSVLRLVMEYGVRSGTSLFHKLKGKSPVHAALIGRHQEVLSILLEKEPNFIKLKDEKQRTLLHCAASANYITDVPFLINKCPYYLIEHDENGMLPIHLAAMNGHIGILEELLKHYYDPYELLTSYDQNILHIAASFGNYKVVRYILRNPELKKVVNEKDKDENTALHLASMRWHPKIVSALTWDKSVEVNLVNKDGFTPLDAAEFYMDGLPSFRQRLSWSALKAAGGVRSSSPRNGVTKPSNLLSTDSYKDRVNTLLLVATLVATVTFAAGFTMPGGYSSSEPNIGMSTMLKHRAFHIFVLCDTMAMYTALAVVVTLIWAQLGDISFVVTSLRFAIPFLGVALMMMSLAFMSGVYLVVSKLNWLAAAVLGLGFVFVIIVALLFFPLCFPVTSSWRAFRYITFYLICLASFINGNL